jgi:hypothetical protein
MPKIRSPRLLVFVVVALVAVACGGGKSKSSAQGAGSGQGLPGASPSPPAAGKCPLTGLDPPPGVKADRFVLAVKIDGSIASKTPSGQSGLDSADVVYDEPIEGGFGRFLALYQCGNPTRVGPVREADPEDPSLLTQYGSGILASAGIAPAVLQVVTSTAGLVNEDSIRHGTAYFRDSTGRQAPYNLFADPAKLRAYKVPAIYASKPLSAPPSQFSFVPLVTPAASGSPRPSASPRANSIRFQLGPKVQYQYDTATASYLRQENGQPHLSDSGTQIRVMNVVVMWVQMSTGQITDAAGNTSIPVPTVTGTGNAMVVTRGVEHDGTWSRPDNTSVISFVDAAGKPMPFTPGNTWIHLIPKDQPVYVQ